MRWSDRALVVLAVLALAGCGSGTRPSPSAANSEAKEAAEVQVKLGRGYMEKGELEVAMEKLQRALQLDPRSVDAHTLLAVLNERIKRPEQAERFYRKAEQLAPDNGEVNNNLGAFLCGSGRYQEADAHFTKALADPFYRSPAAALTNAGVCALKAGEPARAEEHFRRALSIRADNATALFEMAKLSHFGGDGLRARAFLQRLEAIVPGDPTVLDLGQRIETRLGDADAARRYADRLKNEFPDYVPDASLEGPTSP
ncbi:MAG TPA: type IV pilus biogenesis/stability protein PilW [Chiayiivirga sp.]|nr:type IV pilus biogenesis/stability protein PilW [Chiayiivirga sp.]